MTCSSWGRNLRSTSSSSSCIPSCLGVGVGVGAGVGAGAGAGVGAGCWVGVGPLLLGVALHDELRSEAEVVDTAARAPIRPSALAKAEGV